MSSRNSRLTIRLRKGTPANRELQKRIASSGPPAALPLVHITPVGVAREIVRSRKLQVSKCSVFEKKLLYFFVLRPAYRHKDGDSKSHQINRFPFVFILSPEAAKTPFHVYPFDTGGAANGRFVEGADPHVYLDDYELDPNYLAVAGHIAWAFGSVDAYYNGDLRSDILGGVPTHETVTRGFVDIAMLARAGSNQPRPDKRASAIEIAVSHDIDLKGNVLLVILPKQYLEEGSDTPNTDFINSLKAEGIAWEVYDWQPNKKPNEFQDEISRIARTWFEKNGYFR